MSYHLAPALRALTNEINAKWGRQWPTVSIGDGWIGDTSHQARKSDHNPDYSAGGVVRAVDIGIQGRDAGAILDAVIGDRRVWYVIHKGIIYSRTYGWEARRYKGNPHSHHIHVSIVGMEVDAATARKHANDTSAWFDTPPKTPGVTRFLNAPTLAKRRALAKRLAKNGRTPEIRTWAKRWVNRDKRTVNLLKRHRRWKNLRAAAYRQMRDLQVK